MVNKLRGTLHVAAVKPPGFGDRRKDMLKDIAVLTGGQAVTEDLGIKLESVTLKDLGRIVYFRPGHETFPTYHDPNVLKVIENAVHWAAPVTGIKPVIFGNRKLGWVDQK